MDDGIGSDRGASFLDRLAKKKLGLDKPEIMVEPGSIPAMLEAAEQALITKCPDLYQRGGMLVRTARIAQEHTEQGFKRPAGSLSLLPVTTDFLMVRLNESAVWQRKTSEE